MLVNVGRGCMHGDGNWKRNDYIGVSMSLPVSMCTTCVPEEVDFSLQKEDHRPFFAQATVFLPQRA
jgi:hypothetical protein